MEHSLGFLVILPIVLQKVKIKRLAYFHEHLSGSWPSECAYVIYKDAYTTEDWCQFCLKSNVHYDLGLNQQSSPEECLNVLFKKLDDISEGVQHSPI